MADTKLLLDDDLLSGRLRRWLGCSRPRRSFTARLFLGCTLIP